MREITQIDVISVRRTSIMWNPLRLVLSTDYQLKHRKAVRGVRTLRAISAVGAVRSVRTVRTVRTFRTVRTIKTVITLRAVQHQSNYELKKIASG